MSRALTDTAARFGGRGAIAAVGGVVWIWHDFIHGFGEHWESMNGENC